MNKKPMLTSYINSINSLYDTVLEFVNEVHIFLTENVYSEVYSFLPENFPV